MKSWLSRLYYDRGWRFYAYRLRYALLGLLHWNHRPDIRFIILAQGRSGSTLLSQLLNNSPHIYSDNEVFGAGMPKRLIFPRLYLNLRMKSFRSKVYGCKVKIYDLQKQHGMSDEQAISFLRQRFEEGWKILHLRRDNKLRQVLSSLVAESTHTYHLSKHQDHRSEAIYVDAESIPFRIHWLKEFDLLEDMALKGFEKFEVSYENDLLVQGRHQELLDAMMHYFKLPTCEAKVMTIRTSKDSLKDYIANHKEVIEILRQSGNEHYLQPDELT